MEEEATTSGSLHHPLPEGDLQKEAPKLEDKKRLTKGLKLKTGGQED